MVVFKKTTTSRRATINNHPLLSDIEILAANGGTPLPVVTVACVYMSFYVARAKVHGTDALTGFFLKELDEHPAMCHVRRMAQKEVASRKYGMFHPSGQVDSRERTWLLLVASPSDIRGSPGNHHPSRKANPGRSPASRPGKPNQACQESRRLE